MTSTRPVSPKAQKLGLAIVCGIFIVVGLAVWIPKFLVPFLDWWAMRSWKELPCTILRAPSGRASPEESQVLFQYEFLGDLHQARTNLDPLEAAFGMGRAATLKAGSATVCYVNPREPAVAVLDRSLDPELFFWCAPLGFVLLPGLALILGLRTIGKLQAAGPEPPPAPGPGSIVLEPGTSRGCSPIAQLGLLVVLVGIILIILFIPGFRETWPARLFYLAMPVLGSGLLLRSLAYRLFAVANPRVTLSVTPGQGSPGGSIDVRWDSSGSVDRARDFTIVLRGSEETRHRSGKTTIERRSVFAEIPVAKGRGKDLRRGSATVQIPFPVMHSVVHGSRSVRWSFDLVCAISFWPDVSERYFYDLVPRKGAPP